MEGRGRRLTTIIFNLSNRVKPRKTLFVIAGVQDRIRSEYFSNTEG